MQLVVALQKIQAVIIDGHVLLAVQPLIKRGVIAIMLNKNIVQEKYNELYEQYSNKSIDDFDVYVRSRLVEFIINTFGESSDDALNLVNSVLENKNTYADSQDDVSKTQKTKDIVVDKEEFLGSKKIHLEENNALKKIGALSLLALGAFIGYRLLVKKNTR